MKTFNDNLIEMLPRLRAYAIMLTHNRAHADDIVQDAVLRALAAQHQFQVGTNFSAWMHRIVRNCFINELRVQKRAPTSTDDMEGELLAANTDVDDVILLRQLSEAMGNLPASQQEALVLVCAGGLSYEEAADVQGCAIGTLKSRLFRARTYLAGVVGYEPYSKHLLEAHANTPKREKPGAHIADALLPRSREGKPIDLRHSERHHTAFSQTA